MMLRLLLPALAALGLAAADPPADAGRWWSHVRFLASDELQGRLTGTPEHRKAADYVAAAFERAGLLPAGVHGYIQPVRLNTRRLIESESGLALVRRGREERLELGGDAILTTRIDPAESVEAALVFAGYGLTVPELNYDDLGGLDLRGKIAVYLSGGPAHIPGPLRSHYQSAQERYRFLGRAGAIGAVVIPNPASADIPWSRTAATRLQVSMSLADPELAGHHGLRFAATFNPERAGKLFAGSDHTFAGLLELANAGKPLPRFALPASVRARIRVERGEVESQNVAALLPGSDPALKNETIVLSAHLDHLGVGAAIGGDRIYNGAMDNAAGIAALLEIAGSLHHARLRRSVLFLAVTAEEKGLLGSRYFAAHPTVPAGGIAANLNLDMFLPLYPMRSVIAYGLQESDLGDRLREVAAPLGVQVLDDPEPRRNSFIRSDQYNFIRRGVPALAFKIGYEKESSEEQIFKQWLKERYHAPSDDLAQARQPPSRCPLHPAPGSVGAGRRRPPRTPRMAQRKLLRTFSHAHGFKKTRIRPIRPLMEASAIALQGLQNAEALLERAATRIARAGATDAAGNPVDVVDLSREMVALILARDFFKGNARVLETAGEMQKHVLDILG
jgi:Zn-dependent M28 family amino/carboxypeptidase